MSGDRILLTLATFAFAGLCYALMLKGWRGRQRRQAALPAPPPAPEVAAPVLVGPVAGLFVGTTSASDWLDRVAVHGLAHRAAARLSIAADGVHIDRDGEPELYLPFASLTSAGVGDALAGKVIGKEGLLLLGWQLEGTPLVSGFRADDHAVHARLADEIGAHLDLTDRRQSSEAS